MPRHGFEIYIFNRSWKTFGLKFKNHRSLYIYIMTYTRLKLLFEFERTRNLINMNSNQKNTSTSVGVFLIWNSGANRARQNDQPVSSEWTGYDQKSLICHQHLSDRFCRIHKYKKKCYLNPCRHVPVDILYTLSRVI